MAKADGAEGPPARDLERAFDLVADILSRGARPEAAAGGVRVDDPEGRVPDDVRRGLEEVPEAARTVLAGPRRRSCRGLREVVASPLLRDAEVHEVAAIVLEERSRIGTPHRGVGADAAGALAAAASDAHGLVVPAQRFPGRAALGKLMADAGLTRMPVVEVDPRARRDGRDVLAGSFWTRLRARPGGHGTFVRALLAAVQARSLRGPALNENGPRYYAACAARAMAAEGADAAAVARRLRMPLHVAAQRAGLEPPPGGGSGAPAAATSRQVEAAERRIARLPALARAFPDGWREDAAAASAGITAADAVLNELGARLERASAEHEARMRLGAGESLAEAAARTGIDPDELRGRLEVDFADRLDRLAGRVGERIGAEVPVREILSPHTGAGNDG